MEATAIALPTPGKIPAKLGDSIQNRSGKVYDRKQIVGNGKDSFIKKNGMTISRDRRMIPRLNRFPNIVLKRIKLVDWNFFGMDRSTQIVKRKITMREPQNLSNRIGYFAVTPRRKKNYDFLRLTF